MTDVQCVLIRVGIIAQRVQRRRNIHVRSHSIIGGNRRRIAHNDDKRQRHLVAIRIHSRDLCHKGSEGRGVVGKCACDFTRCRIDGKSRWQSGRGKRQRVTVGISEGRCRGDRCNR
jgi:hypothetical protein